MRIQAVSNSEEHYSRFGGTRGDTTSSDGTLKNNGHTVVSILIVMLRVPLQCIVLCF